MSEKVGGESAFVCIIYTQLNTKSVLLLFSISVLIPVFQPVYRPVQIIPTTILEIDGQNVDVTRFATTMDLTK